MVTLKMVHLNNREFCPYNIAGTLDKQYVLAGDSCPIGVSADSCPAGAP